MDKIALNYSNTIINQFKLTA